MKERKVKAKDARLFKASFSLAEQFIDEKPAEEGRNAIDGELQEQNIKDDFNDVMNALKDRLDVGKRDMGGIKRAAKKARAIKKRGG